MKMENSNIRVSCYMRLLLVLPFPEDGTSGLHLRKRAYRICSGRSPYSMTLLDFRHVQNPSLANPKCIKKV